MSKSPCKHCKYNTNCKDSGHCYQYLKWLKQYKESNKRIYK